MGGSLRAGGNHTLAAEFNFAGDPFAAREVLRAGFRGLRLVPIDPCLQARMRVPERERLAAVGTVASAVALESLAYWSERIERPLGTGLYDPLAWLATTRPDLLLWEEVYVAVDVGGDVAHGASLADWMGRSDEPPNVRAAVGVRDRNAVFEALYEALGTRSW